MAFKEKSIRAVPRMVRGQVGSSPMSRLRRLAVGDRVRETVRKGLERTLDPTTFMSMPWEPKAMPLVCGLSLRESLKGLGLHIEADRPAGLIYITQRCDAAGLMNVSVGLVKVQELLSEWQLTRGTVEVEEWMITSIVGKGGSSISALQKKTRSIIKLDRQNLRLDVQSPDSESLKSTIEVLRWSRISRRAMERLYP